MCVVGSEAVAYGLVAMHRELATTIASRFAGDR
jgi:hypothetical protein